jgi:ATP-binding cassette subfamily B protein
MWRQAVWNDIWLIEDLEAALFYDAHFARRSMFDRSPMTLTHYTRVLMRYLTPYRGAAGGVVLLLMLDVVFSISWPLSFKFLIDNITNQVDRDFLTEVVAAMFVAVLLAAVADFLRGYGYALLGSRIKRDARQAVFRHLQDMSMFFFKERRCRDLIAHLSGDLSLLESAATSGVAYFLLGATGIVVSTTMLFLLDWRLAVLTVLGLVLCVVLPRPLVRLAAAARRPVENMESELESIAHETIVAQPVVKAFGLENHFVNGFVQLTETLSDQSVKSKFLTYAVERAPNLIILTFQVLVMGFGLLMVAGGERTLGTIIAFQGIFLYVVRSVQTLTQATPVLLESINGLGRVQELLSEKSSVADAPDAQTQRPVRESIRLHNVSFGYHADQHHIERVSLTIHCGTSVAFVGASGCGKSTLFNLLVRFYDPDEGSVTFDGVDIRKIKLESLRGQMGVVFQENNLFNVSLRENIRLGWAAATDQEVETAARQAEIHEWISSLPKGYDTLVGEHGARLSGGQRQRVAIARALVRQPRILLMDEASSALDPEAEAAINAQLRDLSAGRTVISVTHRLSAVQDADCIHFIERGRIKESGNHHQLLAAGGAYAKQWWRQSGFTINDQGNQGGVAPARLRDYPVLSELDPAALEQAAQFFVAESYPAGHNVVTEGELGDRLFLIARGQVEVIKADPIEGPRKLAVLEDGDYFGELALLQRVPRTATVRTLTPTLLLSLRDTHFQALLKKQPKLETRFRQRQAPLTRIADSPVSE